MNTLLDYLLVLAVAALLAGPTLYGALGERRLDRQIRAAEQEAQVLRDRHRREQAGARTPRVSVRHAPGH
ncbi:hypothetical protein OTB20_16970 [Streptomyces sp. H27-H1]|nr:hypothetical protein [Streptomyces sp. H27-H1]MCY0927876.1 hypothetical protein [Streptomyces sp. H27-H1]